MTPRHPPSILSAQLFGIFLALILVVLSSASVEALTLDSDDEITTSVSNSSMTFNTVTVYVDQVTIETTSIELHNASFITSGSIFNLTGVANYTRANYTLDSSQFLTVTAPSSETVYLHSNFSNILSGRVEFPIPGGCAGLEYITFTPTAAAAFNPSLSCPGNNTVIITGLTNIGPGANQFKIEYIQGGGSGDGGAGGGGGGGGGSGGGTNTTNGTVIITPGSEIQLQNFTIESDAEWHVGSEEEITVKIWNASGDLVDPQFIPTITFENDAIKHKVVRKSQGIYEITIEALNVSAGTTLSFNVTVEDHGKVMSQSYSITVNDQSTFDRVVETTVDGIAGFFERALRWIVDHWIMAAVGIIVLIALLILLILLSRDRKDDRELAQYTQ